MTLQEKRAEWGRKYRERKRQAAQAKFTMGAKTPAECNIVEADGSEHAYKFD